MTCDLDELCPNYVVWCGGEWGADRCDRPDLFTETAREGMRLLKRLFSLPDKRGDYHLVPYWARTLAEVLASSGTRPSDVLYRVRYDEALRTSVRAAISLGGYVGLRDFLRGEGYVP